MRTHGRTPQAGRFWAFLAIPVLLLAVGGWAVAGKSSKRLSDDERGKELYERHCIQCHGAETAGDGAAAAAMVTPVPDVRGKLNDKHRDANADLVLGGKGLMPGFEASFDDYDARRVVRYMEKQARKGAGVVDKPSEPEAVDTDNAGGGNER